MGGPQETASEALRGERRWSVGFAVLDERHLRLEVAGEVVKLERKQIEVLLYLLQHAGDVVTEEEILNSVWPGRVLGDSSLAQAISRLRRALGDQDRTMIATVHGFGYRLAAPVRCEIVSRPQPAAHFDFKPGDSPPLRPHWKLVERLGIGGNGEAWLVRQEKTREQRVFKFAKDEVSLAALKREITLFRLLNDTLGNSARIVQLHDWNLEHPPCFIEAEYLPGGSLSQWAERLGGLERLPLPDRLETIARIADAVAALHAVGVLHKDLKPSNVLVERVESGPGAIRIADLGCGSVLDPERLRRLNITRHGFTTTALGVQTSGGTPMYLAPELIDGKPPTVQADIYALGVMLYQIVVGDFGRALHPGWERDVPDELLRQDIAAAAEGDANHRLENAAELGRRLRVLEARRTQLSEARAAEARAAASVRSIDRARARRLGLAVAGVALAAGSVTSTYLWLEAREASVLAEAEARRARTVSDFLLQDVLFLLSSGDRPVKGLTLEEFLKAASEQAGQRFAELPETAAEVDVALGRSFENLGLLNPAYGHLTAALDHYESVDGKAGERTVDVATALLPVTFGRGMLRSDIDRFGKILDSAIARYGVDDARILRLGAEMGRARSLLGQWQLGADLMRDALDRMPVASDPDAGLTTARLRMSLGISLVHLARFDEALVQLGAAASELTAARGRDHIDIAAAKLWSAHACSFLDRFDEAGQLLDEAADISDRWIGDASGYARTNRLFRGQLLLEKGEVAGGLEMIELIAAEVFAVLDASAGAVLDETWAYAEPLALAYERAGRTGDAHRMMKRALASADLALGPQHPETQRIRVAVASLSLALGDTATAQTLLLQDGNAIDFGDLPPRHPIRSGYARGLALLHLARGSGDLAKPLYDEALEGHRRTYGDLDWRVIELQKSFPAFVAGRREQMIRGDTGVDI